MKDFSAWVDAWNAYEQTPPPSPSTTELTIMIIGVVLFAVGFTGVLYVASGHGGPGLMCLSVLALVAGLLMPLVTACFIPAHDAPEPPTLATQIEKVWGLEQLDCGNGNLFPTSSMPDYTDLQCVAYTTDKRFNVTVHTDGNKIGLYTDDNKVLKPLGKDTTK